MHNRRGRDSNPRYLSVQRFSRPPPDSVSPEPAQTCEQPPDNSADSSASLAGNDPDLAAVLQAWPTLPEAIKAGILATVRAVGGTLATAEGGETR